MERKLGVGSFIGWRGWGIERDEEERLWLVTAAGHEMWWPKFMPAEANCDAGFEPPCDWNKHHCGLYATKDRKRVPFGWSSPLIAVGRVKLWGRVNVQPWGYRAQFAYPVELRAIRTSKTWRARKGVLAELCEEYGLEW